MSAGFLGFVEDQVATFRGQAEQLTRFGARAQAEAVERCAEELEGAARRWWLEELSVAEAAAESGYSEERLRELVREGKVEGHGDGEARSIRVRRCALPKKPAPPRSRELTQVAQRLGIR